MKAIKTKYLGPTNYRGSRVRATAEGVSGVTLTWDDSLNSDENHRKAAIALCAKMGWKGTMSSGGLENFCVHTFVADHTTFKVGGK